VFFESRGEGVGLGGEDVYGDVKKWLV